MRCEGTGRDLEAVCNTKKKKKEKVGNGYEKGRKWAHSEQEVAGDAAGKVEARGHFQIFIKKV